MFRTVLAGAVCAWAMAGAAAAEPFEAFVTLCVATAGDRPAAHAAAKTAGWTELPADPADADDSEFREQVLLANFNPTGHGRRPASPEVMLTGWGDGEEMIGAESVILEVCAIMSPQITAEAMQGRIVDLMGEPASEPDEPAMWLYSRDGDRFVSEAELTWGDGRIEAAAMERNLYAVMLIEQDGVGVLMLGAVRSVLRLRSER